jgi:hypothetical protein
VDELAIKLKDKVTRYPNRRQATIRRRASTRKVPPEARTHSSAIHWHSLDDLTPDAKTRRVST